MSWYVLQCRTGQEETIIRSCKAHLTSEALEEAFVFRCERLWRTEGNWIPLLRDMFPGYVFLQSSRPEILYDELKQYRGVFRVMEEPGYLISVYEEEERMLRDLCGDQHVLKLSYGFKDEIEGCSKILKGPLKGQEDKILKINWHKRIAIIGMEVARKEAIVWAGVVPAQTELGKDFLRENALIS